MGTCFSSDSTTVRKEWYSLDDTSKSRVLKAIDRMLKDGSFFSVAQLHGWPSNQERRGNGGTGYGFCEHATERFGGWHREFVYQFESLLKAADKANGNDGSIGLPYWDWCNNPTIPPELRQWTELPSSGIPSQHRNFAGLRPDIIASITTPSGGISLQVPWTRVSDWRYAVRNMWRLHNFPQFVSKNGINIGNYSDLEQIHDQIHGEVGGIMGLLEVAAFHPLFWLHHCNIDRLLETYLQLNNDSEGEISRDAVSTPLEPWKADVRSTFKLQGSQYDRLAYDLVPPELLEARNQVKIAMMSNRVGPHSIIQRDITEPVRFKASTSLRITIDQKRVNQRSYNVYAFAIPLGIKRYNPRGHPSVWDQDNYFIGKCTVLHGRDVQFCSNCQRSKEFTISLQIDRGLTKLGINRLQCNILVLYQDLTSGTILTAEQVYDRRLINNGKRHQITGPFFAASADLKYGMRSLDVLSLQKFLRAKGWYDGKLDGIFAGKTVAASINFQKYFGLKGDAIWGPKTKDFVLNKYILNEEPDNNGDYRHFEPGSTITYTLRSCPRYLDEIQLLKEIDRAFDQWEPHCRLIFDRVPNNSKAHISIYWEDITSDNLLNGHGRGGLLAKSCLNMICFDESENWILQDGKVPYLGGFYFYNVMLHHVGKVIGLSSSGNRDDVMYPFYDSTKKTLSEGDVQAAKILYGTPGLYGKQQCHKRQTGAKRLQIRKGYQHNNLPPRNVEAYQKQRAQLDPIRRGGSVEGARPTTTSGAPRRAAARPLQPPYGQGVQSIGGSGNVIRGYRNEQPNYVNEPMAAVPSTGGSRLEATMPLQQGYGSGVQIMGGSGNVIPGYGNQQRNYTGEPVIVLPQDYESKADTYIPAQQYTQIGGSRNVYQM